MSKAERGCFEMGGRVVEPGTRVRFELPAALLPTQTQLSLPVTVLHGTKPGARLWLSAAVHGDELNGVEIIREVLDQVDLDDLVGTLVAVPIVNVLGFIQQSRYFPDRRDLNRSFPGSSRGSLASRIAHLFMREVVRRCTHGIDLHTASLEKTNYPQVRANLHDPETRRIAEAFGAPLMVHSDVRDGSLRGAAGLLGIPVLVYEAGEPRRFNPEAIQIGVDGVLGVMRGLKMTSRSRLRRRNSIFVHESSWIRARRGGVLRLTVSEGEVVAAEQRIGIIADPLGDDPVPVVAPHRGVVIGRTLNPIVHGGDAIVHVGQVQEEVLLPLRRAPRQTRLLPRSPGRD